MTLSQQSFGFSNFRSTSNLTEGHGRFSRSSLESALSQDALLSSWLAKMSKSKTEGSRLCQMTDRQVSLNMVDEERVTCSLVGPPCPLCGLHVKLKRVILNGQRWGFQVVCNKEFCEQEPVPALPARYSKDALRIWIAYCRLVSP